MKSLDPYAREDDPSFWTAQEAADDLRVSTQILRRIAVKENRLPYARNGKRLRFVPADVRRYAASLRDEA